MADHKDAAAAQLAALASSTTNLGSLEGSKQFLQIIMDLVGHAELRMPVAGSGTFAAGADAVLGSTNPADRVVY